VVNIVMDLDMLLFNDYWTSAYARIQKPFALNPFSLLPPGPPVGTHSQLDLSGFDSFTTSVLASQIVAKVHFSNQHYV
jgi:hypothetical protein